MPPYSTKTSFLEPKLETIWDVYSPIKAEQYEGMTLDNEYKQERNREVEEERQMEEELSSIYRGIDREERDILDRDTVDQMQDVLLNRGRFDDAMKLESAYGNKLSQEAARSRRILQDAMSIGKLDPEMGRSYYESQGLSEVYGDLPPDAQFRERKLRAFSPYSDIYEVGPDGSMSMVRAANTPRQTRMNTYFDTQTQDIVQYPAGSDSDLAFLASAAQEPGRFVPGTAANILSGGKKSTDDPLAALLGEDQKKNSELDATEEESPGFFDAVSRGLKRGAAGFAETMASMDEAFLNGGLQELGIVPLSREELKATGQYLDKQNEDLQDSLTYQVAQAGPDTLGGVVSIANPLAPLTAPAYFGSQVAGAGARKYYDARDEGYSEDDALTAGLISGAGELAGEAIEAVPLVGPLASAAGVDRLLGRGVGRLAAQVAGSGLGEGASEAVDIASDIYALDKEITPGDAAARVGQSALVGSVLGPAQYGASTALNRLTSSEFTPEAVINDEIVAAPQAEFESVATAPVQSSGDGQLTLPAPEPRLALPAPDQAFDAEGNMIRLGETAIRMGDGSDVIQPQVEPVAKQPQRVVIPPIEQGVSSFEDYLRRKEISGEKFGGPDEVDIAIEEGFQSSRGQKRIETVEEKVALKEKRALDRAIKKRMQRGIVARFGSEQGSISPALLGLNLFKKTGEDLGVDATAPQNVKQTPDFEGEAFFDPEYLGGKAVAGYRKFFVKPSTLADKFPKFRPVFEAALEGETLNHSIANDLSKTASPFLHGDSDRAGLAIMQLRKAKRENPQLNMPVTPEFLKANTKLNDDEIGQVIAHQKSMNEGLDLLVADLTADFKGKLAKKPGQLKAFETALATRISELKNSWYIPARRDGKFYVYAEDKTGGTEYYALAKTRQEAAEMAAKLGKENPSLTVAYGKKGASQRDKAGTVGKKGEEGQGALESLPDDLVSIVAQAEADAGIVGPATREIQARIPKRSGGQKKGFRTHLLPAKLTEGYGTDFRVGTAQYISGLAKHLSARQSKEKMNQAIESMRAEGGSESQIAQYAERYRDYVYGSTNELTALRGAMFHTFLGASPAAAALNLTSSITTTYPALATLGVNPEKAWAKATGKFISLATNKAKFRQTNPELSKAMDEAKRRGILDSQFVTDVNAIRQGRDPKKKLTPGQISSLMFSISEGTTRTHAFIAAFENQPKNLSFEQKMKGAQDFINRTQGIYSKIDRPQVGRWLGTIPMMFKGWVGIWSRLLRNNMTKENWPVAARMILANVATSGLVGLPIAKEIIQALEAFGEDPKRLLREYVGNGAISDILLYGASEPTGVSISGAAGFQELVPIQQAEGSIGNVLLGPAKGILDKASRAREQYKMGEYDRALEELAPRGVQGAMKAVREAREGVKDFMGVPLTGDDGKPLMPTTTETIAQLGGFQTSRRNRAFEAAHSRAVISESAKKGPANLNLRIAKGIIAAKQTGDRAELDAVLTEVRDYNAKAKFKAKPHTPTIKKYMKELALGSAYKDISKARKEARPEIVEYETKVYRRGL